MLKKSGVFILIIAVILVIAGVKYGSFHNITALQGNRHQTVNRGDISYELYLPEGYSASKTYPLLVMLAPDGNGSNFYKPAGYTCSQNGFVLVCSNTFRNNVPNNIFVPQVLKTIEDVQKTVKIDKSSIYIGGFSGGGMGSYMMAYFNPGYFKGLLINNGRINDFMKNKESLRRMKVSKVVIMSSKNDGIATPAILTSQKELLESAGIEVLFLNFSGGHEIAPSSLYERAIKWFINGY